MGCRRFLVSGKVQGVWFRASTRQQAVALGLTGEALNLPDGRVEVIACGSNEALDALAKWLWQGPERARVDEVVSEAIPERSFQGFATG
jgi:acylphosphatase